MMTIKVIHKTQEGKELKFLFEADSPVYNYESFKDYKDWCAKYRELTDTYTLPCKLIMDDVIEDTETNSFLYLHFYCNNNHNLSKDVNADRLVLLIQRALVYIMQDGKTVDTISC